MKTKKEAEYTDHADKEKIILGIGGCKNCIYFKANTCKIVSGRILPEGGCKYFTKV